MSDLPKITSLLTARRSALGSSSSRLKTRFSTLPGLHVRGIHLGSFYNVNQPDPSGQLPFHDSTRRHRAQEHVLREFPLYAAGHRAWSALRDFHGLSGARGFLGFAVDFEADSKWDSQWDGLLVTFNKRMTKHIGWGASYTWSKGIDNGPNPSFVLIPQDTLLLRQGTGAFRRSRRASLRGQRNLGGSDAHECPGQ